MLCTVLPRLIAWPSHISSVVAWPPRNSTLLAANSSHAPSSFLCAPVRLFVLCSRTTNRNISQTAVQFKLASLRNICCGSVLFLRFSVYLGISIGFSCQVEPYCTQSRHPSSSSSSNSSPDHFLLFSKASSQNTPSNSSGTTIVYQHWRTNSPTAAVRDQQRTSHWLTYIS